MDVPLRPFLCPVADCDRRFHRKFTLSEHLTTHTGEKPFQCTVPSCDKRFTTSGNLSRHRRTHTLKKIACSAPGCMRIFTKPEMLMRHLKVHMVAIDHRCTILGCLKTFSTAGNLTRHMRRKHKLSCSRQSSSSYDVSSPAHAKHSVGSYTASSPDAAHQTPVCQVPFFEFHLEPWTPRTSFATQSAAAEPTEYQLSDQDIVDLLDCLFTHETAAHKSAYEMQFAAKSPLELSPCSVHS
uniref:Wilms tumor protein homolog n=1 Tax=Globisporangium ultimum (strain ATCC 200006 / CBS 805.95 / DAOM BR144) TaxID=431595 RepID=K3WQJ3_GLOUD